MNKIFKIIIIICALVLVLSISGSLIYYYVFFRPGIEKAEIRLQEQKATEEALRKENLEKCLKETEDWYTEALKGISSVESGSLDSLERALKILRDIYQDKINACNMMYGK